MEVGGAGIIDLEAVDTWKEGVNLDVSIDQQAKFRHQLGSSISFEYTLKKRKERKRTP